MSVAVRVVLALPDRAHCVALQLGDGATVADAVAQALASAPFAGLRERFDLDRAPVGVFGERVDDRARVLEDGDRVEFYRPLEMDPREARRRRVADDGASSP